MPFSIQCSHHFFDHFLPSAFSGIPGQSGSQISGPLDWSSNFLIFFIFHLFGTSSWEISFSLPLNLSTDFFKLCFVSHVLFSQCTFFSYCSFLYSICSILFHGYNIFSTLSEDTNNFCFVFSSALCIVYLLRTFFFICLLWLPSFILETSFKYPVICD